MKHIIFCWSVVSSLYIFPMDNRKLTIKNDTDKQVIIFYKKVLPGRVQPKQEKLLQHHTATISLPATHGLRLRILGYPEYKIFVPEYQNSVLIGCQENNIVISQGNKTLGIIKPMEGV